MTLAQLQNALRQRVANALGLSPAQVDVDLPMADLGLSSEQVVQLAAEFESEFGYRLGPEVIYDYPTITALSRHIVDQGVQSAAPATAWTPIAVVGIGCRFPRAGAGPDRFYEFLREAGDAVSEIADDRWDNDAIYDPSGTRRGTSRTRWAALLDDVKTFDPGAFAIPPAEAASMDPQQRLLLEASWHAVEDGGESWRALAGSRTGVFVGISQSEYARDRNRDIGRVDGTSATGSALSIAANRISYVFDLCGPSMAVDTACSSSLSAVHLACRSLALGECDLALAGGVNIVLSPELSVAFTAAGLMSPTGRCRAFDAAADGYVRGEGVGLVLLKRLDDAHRDGNRIYAQIMGSAVVQDGRSNGLMAPRGEAQASVIQSACAAAGVTPGDLEMVEAHGSGTALGDVIEAMALGRTVGKDREAGAPCLIGSVKSNIGHLEAAAGIAGLIKAALCIHRGETLPSLHFNPPNPGIPFEDLGLAVSTTVRPWTSERRLAGVSSFGFGGTNVHLVLAAAAAPAADPERIPQGPLLLGLSGHDGPALRALAQLYARRLEAGSPDEGRALIRAAARRTAMAERLAVAGTCPKDVARRLSEGLASGAGRARTARGGRLAFVFCGQGAIWPGVAHDLFERDSTFREALLRCDDALRPYLPSSVLPALFSQDAGALLKDTAWAQPALFALQVALAETVKSWGVQPAACIGHSVGEVAAACVSGLLPLDSAARLVALRGAAMSDARGRGGMASAICEPALIAELVDGRLPDVDVAAVNAPRSIVVSGDQAALEAVLARLREHGVEPMTLEVDYAFHSAQMDGAAAWLAANLTPPSCGEPTAEFYSSTQPGRHKNAPLDARYWAQNVRQTVHFRQAVERALADSIDSFLEIGPHPVLRRDLEANAEAMNISVATYASLRRGTPGLHALAECAGELYAGGVLPDLRACVASSRADEVPPYEWVSRSEYWIPASRDCPAPSLQAGLGQPVSLAGDPSQMIWQGRISLELLPFIAGHRVLGRPVVPATLFIDMLARAAGQALGGPAVCMQDLEFLHLTSVPEHGEIDIQISARLAGEKAELALYIRKGQKRSWHMTVRGEATLNAAPPSEAVDIDRGLVRCLDRYPKGLYYQLLRKHGLDYREEFMGLGEVAGRRGEAIARLSAEPGLKLRRSPFALEPMLLDNALQACAASLGARQLNADDGAVFLPRRLARLAIHDAERLCCWSHAKLRDVDGADAIFDIALTDADGRCVASIEGLRMAGSTRSARREEQLRSALGQWLHQIDWVKAPPLQAGEPVDPPNAEGDVLLLGDEAGLAGALASRWRAEGRRCVLVGRGTAFRQTAEDAYTIDPTRREHLQRLLGAGRDRSWADIVNLWSLDGPVHSPSTDLTPALSVVALVQAMQSAVVTGRPQVTTVTRGAVAAGRDPLSAPVQAMAWGTMRAILLEHPDIEMRCIDLDPQVSDTDAEVEALIHEIGRTDHENQVALRGAERFVARLHAAPYVEPVAWAADPDATYLVTGGTGALGKLIVECLIDNGARHVVLAHRSAAEPWAKEVRPSGCAVYACRCNIGDETEANELFRRLEALPRLAGVVHLAGVLDDCAVMNLDEERLRQVATPKVNGAQHLLDATRHAQLDFMVFFSSAASTLGSPGQTNYCAANACLDALAAMARAAGRNVTSIGWGPWAGEGMASGRDLSSALMSSGLITMIPPDLGMDLFLALLRADAAHVLVLPFNVAALMQFFPATSGLSFYSEVGHGFGMLRSDGTTTIVHSRPAIEAPFLAARDETESIIVGIWQRALAMRGIGVLDELFALGGDSVLASQILAQINDFFSVRIDPESAFDGFTVAALAAMVEEQLLQRVNDLDDDTVEALMAQGV